MCGRLGGLFGVPDVAFGKTDNIPESQWFGEDQSTFFVDRNNGYEWANLPFKDNQFDYTFSTDVLEHIPLEMVEKTIKEIYRITRVETFHCIATVDDPNYPNVHLTIESIEWWKGQFGKANGKQVDTHIVNPEEFLLLCHYVNKRRVG